MVPHVVLQLPLYYVTINDLISSSVYCLSFQVYALKCQSPENIAFSTTVTGDKMFKKRLHMLLRNE
jgi:hypothetical protein